MASTTTNHRGDITKNLNISLLILSTIFITLRFYVRKFMIDSVGWDDGFALVAWMVLVTLSALEICEVNNGSGRHIQDVPLDAQKRFFTILPTMELLYFAATCFVRLSIVAVIPRVSKEKKIVRIVWALGAVIVTMSVASFAVLLFSCRPIGALWNTRMAGARCTQEQSQSDLFWTHASVGVCVDLVLLGLPIWLIYSRMLHSMISIKVTLVFGVGLFVVITGIVRLAVMITTNYRIDDTTYTMATLSLWADLEGHVGLWVACFPSLQPLFRVAARKVGLSSNNASSNDNPAASNTWENKSRGYIKSVHEVNVSAGAEYSGTFTDDSSTKKIITADERDVGMEMSHVQPAPSRQIRPGVSSLSLSSG